jgi:hypothetical protein
MSTRPDLQRPDDELASLLARWLNATLGNDELRKALEQLPTDELAPGQRTELARLRAALADALPGERGELVALVRETVESIAYGS